MVSKLLLLFYFPSANLIDYNANSKLNDKNISENLTLSLKKYIRLKQCFIIVVFLHHL